MNLFLDTNILLDVLGQRDPHYAPAARLLAEIEKKGAKATVSAISFNNIHYIMRKVSGAAKAREAVVSMSAAFAIVPLDAAVIQEAINMTMSDFEDAIQYVSAVHAGAEYFVTRDEAHFPKQPLNLVSAGELLATLFPQ